MEICIPYLGVFRGLSFSGNPEVGFGMKWIGAY